MFQGEKPFLRGGLCTRCPWQFSGLSAKKGKGPGEEISTCYSQGTCQSQPLSRNNSKHPYYQTKKMPSFPVTLLLRCPSLWTPSEFRRRRPRCPNVTQQFTPSVGFCLWQRMCCDLSLWSCSEIFLFLVWGSFPECIMLSCFRPLNIISWFPKLRRSWAFQG